MYFLTRSVTYYLFLTYHHIYLPILFVISPKNVFYHFSLLFIEYILSQDPFNKIYIYFRQFAYLKVKCFIHTAECYLIVTFTNFTLVASFILYRCYISFSAPDKLFIIHYILFAMNILFYHFFMLFL